MSATGHPGWWRRRWSAASSGPRPDAGSSTTRVRHVSGSGRRRSGSHCGLSNASERATRRELFSGHRSVPARVGRAQPPPRVLCAARSGQALNDALRGVRPDGVAAARLLSRVRERCIHLGGASGRGHRARLHGAGDRTAGRLRRSARLRDRQGERAPRLHDPRRRRSLARADRPASAVDAASRDRRCQGPAALAPRVHTRVMKRWEIGVISDTHGLVRPEALAALRGVDRVVHAGDIGSADVLARLGKIAPVSAVRGNNDRGPWAEALPLTDVVEVGEVSLYVLHDLHELDLEPRAAGFAAVISGHSHQPRVDTKDGVLYLNPGSAGPRRFKLPISVARVTVLGTRVTARLVALEIAA